MSTTLQPNKIATQTNNIIYLKTPASSNSYQILWEIVENDTAIDPIPETIEIVFKTILPKGTELVFDGMPINASLNRVHINDSVPKLDIEATVTGLSSGQSIHFYMRGMY